MNDELLLKLAEFTHDPLGFVLWAFPWGEPGELENHEGPELWQREILVQLGEGLITPEGAIRLARTSGHGIGKSALVRELHRPMLRSRGYFCAGKLDQLGRNSPYSALAQALRAPTLQPTSTTWPCSMGSMLCAASSRRHGAR